MLCLKPFMFFLDQPKPKYLKLLPSSSHTQPSSPENANICTIVGLRNSRKITNQTVQPTSSWYKFRETTAPPRFFLFCQQKKKIAIAEELRLEYLRERKKTVVLRQSQQSNHWVFFLLFVHRVQCPGFELFAQLVGAYLSPLDDFFLRNQHLVWLWYRGEVNLMGKCCKSKSDS